MAQDYHPGHLYGTCTLGSRLRMKYKDRNAEQEGQGRGVTQYDELLAGMTNGGRCFADTDAASRSR